MGFVEDFKQGQRMVWSAGDWPGFARRIQEASDVLVDRVGVAEGQDFLDVGTGSGNAAIRAAERGARVTGVDLVPEHFDAARRRAAEAGVEVDWLEGDAEQLPFEDHSFDRVVTAFGAIFAPRHDVAAREMVRVARPGGRVGVACWRPDSLNGQTMRVVSSYMPPPPADLKPPMLWGDEEHVRALFEPSGGDISFESASLVVEADSVEAWMEYTEASLGPVVMSKAALEPQGRWPEARAEIADVYERFNQADDGGMRVSMDYLVTLIDLPG